MKKKLVALGMIAIVADAAAAGISKSTNDVELSDLTLANVEALARGETCTNCYNFELIRYSNCSVCEFTQKGTWCNIHDQTPC